MKVVFMGTPDFAKESLESIYNSGYDIIGVVTNPDKPKGRGMKMMPSPVKIFAEEKGLEIYQPNVIKENIEFINIIKDLKPDVICVVAYGKILPKDILDIPQYGCINVHGSLLPKYRGAAPIQWAIINGDTKTGITTIYMDEGLDTGDIIKKQEIDINENETTGELWNRLSKIGGKLLVETLKQIEQGTVKREKQGEDFSMAPMLKKEMSKINWQEKTAKEIKNLVRGLNPIMGAYTYLNEKKIKFWKVEVVEVSIFDNNEFKNLNNGTVLFVDSKKGLFIKTKEGVISVLEIQGENAKRMDICDYLRGTNIKQFDVFK